MLAASDPGISEYSVSETTLEQLFIQFAKHQAPPKTMHKHTGIFVASTKHERG